jgi:hypothetical protein
MTRKQYITLARIDRNEMSNRYNIHTFTNSISRASDKARHAPPNPHLVLA